MLKRCVLLAATIAFFATAAAADPIAEKKEQWKHEYPIYALAACAADAGFDAFFARQQGKDDAPILASARSCLDAKAKPAISNAGENSDLVRSIKDFYASARAWAESGRGEYKSSLTRMATEAHLADKWPAEAMH